jgi:hypothetical protein
MDKLAKRFNAGEIIKANAQAEARDMKRMQERTAEYERMMQEMRRLNLKNVEVTEQVQQLIQCGIEQFEGYGNGEEVLAGKIDLAADETKGICQEAAENICDSIRKESEETRNSTRENTEVVRGDIRAFYTALRDLETKVSANHDTEEAFDRLENAIAQGRYAAEDTMREMAELVHHMEESIGQQEETLRTIREILVATRMSVEEGQKRLEEHVHKENVRVYRNVQAVITDEATKKARDIGTRLDQLENSVKKNSGVKPLLLLTFLLALASVGLQIAQILQLF